MKRRTALKATATLVGGALSVGTISALMSGCKADTAVDWMPSFLSLDQYNTISDIAEIIIPATDTPGANDALVGRYIDEVLGQIWDTKDSTKFVESFAQIDQISNKLYNKGFSKLSSDQKSELVQALADDYTAMKKDNPKQNHIFRSLKELTAAGYCTSEVGAMALLAYDAVPGPFEGCVPLSTSGGKAWAL